MNNIPKRFTEPIDESVELVLQNNDEQPVSVFYKNDFKDRLFQSTYTRNALFSLVPRTIEIAHEILANPDLTDPKMLPTYVTLIKAIWDKNIIPPPQVTHATVSQHMTTEATTNYQP